MLKLEIRTIENLIFDAEIISVSFSSHEGYVTIYEGHEDIVLQVKSGEIEITTLEGNSVFFVLDGIARILGGEKIIMLVNEIETSENLTKEAVQEAIQRAEKSLKDAENSEDYFDYDYEVLRGRLIKELAKDSKVS